MSFPLALPQPLSSPAQPSPATTRPGFTPETRRLLARLPGERGLWVMQAAREETQATRPAPSPYPSGGATQAARLAPPAAGLAHYFLLGALLRGQRALFLDAANGFNPHRLAEMMRRLGREPEELLARVRLSRAFTCFQLAELVERVPAEARRWSARCVFLTGVPEIFDDEELQAAEARRVFARALEGMRRWRASERDLQLSTLVFTSVFTPLRPQPSGLRRWLGTQLERAADGVFRFEETPAGLAVRGGEKFPALCAPSAASASLR
ncbi:MAG: hypothetical protein ACRD4D_08895 [Candidatus Acidiferrales bacterium]